MEADTSLDDTAPINFEDADKEGTISFDDSSAVPIPSTPAQTVRAEKAHFALGADSPGVQELMSQINSGFEGSLRKGIANSEDGKLLNAKNTLLSRAASLGASISPEQAKTILDVAARTPQTDPDSILEKKYSDMLISGVVSLAPEKTSKVPDLPREMDIGAEASMRKQYFEAQLQNQAKKWENIGTLRTVGEYALNMVSFLPWWRQAAALDRPSDMNFLSGKTIKDNVQHLFLLPFPEAKVKFEQAMKYFENKGDTLGGLQFAQAVVAFSTSDEYVNSVMSVADYTTLASFAGKVAGRLIPRKPGAVPSAAPTAPTAEIPRGPIMPAEGTSPIEQLFKNAPEGVKSSDFKAQPDLFGAQPNEQGTFRFMQDGQGYAGNQFPSFKPQPKLGEGDLFYGNNPVPPPGKAREAYFNSGQKTSQWFDVFGDGTPGGSYAIDHARPPVEVNPKTGVFRGPGGKFGKSTLEYKQGELPLGNPEQPAQRSFDLSTGSNKRQWGTPSIEEIKQALSPVTAEVQETRNAIAGALKAHEGLDTPKPEQVIAATGKVEEAANVGSLDRLVNPLEAGAKDLARDVPTFANPKGFLQDSKTVARSRAQELAVLMDDQIKQLLTPLLPSALGGLARVSRLTPEALDVARREAIAILEKQYRTRVGDGILDVIHTPAEMDVHNVEKVSLKIGRSDTRTLFETPEKAHLFAKDHYGLGPNEYTVKNQGYGHYIQIDRHIDETMDAVRDTLVTPRNSTPKGMFNYLLNRVRSAEDLLGLFQRENRQLAVHVPQELKKTVKDFVEKNILTLPKKQLREVEDILRENRDMPNPLNPKERGAWYDTAYQFEQAFVARFGKSPKEAQIMAYDAYKRLSDWDWLTRNIAVYRDKARQAIETFKFRISMGEWSPSFEGKLHDAMPWNVGKADQDAGIWVHDSATGKGTFYYKYGTSPEQAAANRKMIDDLTENRGYKVIQVFDPKKHPLGDIGQTKTGAPLKEQINYVVTNAIDKSPLSWKQVDYRPGGHVIYPGDWYVAQPVIQMGRAGKATYLGDNNALNFSTRAQAQKYADLLDHARILLRDRKLEELGDFVDKNLPHTREQFMDLFQRSNSPFDINHPIVIKQSGKNTIDTNAVLKQDYARGNLIDATKNVHDLSNLMDKSYLMDRDNVLSTVLENGKAMKLGPAEQLDPYIAMNRALNQTIRNLWTNDYKIGAVESWIQEFRGVMKPNERSLMAHPLHSLYNSDVWNNSVSTSERANLAAGKAAQRAIVNFIGSKSELGQTVETLKMKALDTVYEKFGTGKLLDTVISTTSDPVHFFRGIAFHSKLGLFNPVQFFVQAQTMAHTLAVAGLEHGTAGFAAAPMMRWLGHNPKMIDAVADLSTKFGWTKKQFTEMYETFQKTGLYQVAGDATLRDDAWDAPLFRGKIGTFLDAGAMFFNEGERLPRLSAFAASFREWRAANPTIKLGDRELGAIMRRADDMTVNMSRASNASWQSGLLSIPLQFYAFNARMMEQMLGSRLTKMEKFRVFATYSAMYGVPMGLGLPAAGVWPVYDSIKETAMQNGIKLDEGWTKVMTEGLMNQVAYMLTGRDYNVSQRYSPGNQQAIKEAFNGDKKMPEIIMGASGSILSSGFKALYPFLHDVASIVTGQNDYELSSADFLAFFQNIATVDTAVKAYGAAVYGKWYTKTGNVVSNHVNGMDAAMATLGLQPLHVANTFLLNNALKDTKKEQQFYIDKAAEYYRRGMHAAQNNDWATYESNARNAATAIKLGDLNYQQVQGAMTKIIQQNQTLEQRLNWQQKTQAPLSKYKKIFNQDNQDQE